MSALVCYASLNQRPRKMCNCAILDVTVKKILITAFLKKLPFLAKGLHGCTLRAMSVLSYLCSKFTAETFCYHWRQSCFFVILYLLSLSFFSSKGSSSQWVTPLTSGQRWGHTTRTSVEREVSPKSYSPFHTTITLDLVSISFGHV